MSSPKFIFVLWLPDYFLLPVVSLDTDGFEGSDNIKFIFRVHACMCVGVVSTCDSTAYQCFLLDCLRSIEWSQARFILYVIY